jgi:hypothetical protein
MLKIKDNVDLKELEKYGFKKYINFRYYLECEEVTVEVNIESRELYLFSTGAEEIQSMSIPHAVYDLIKDGLVEKVEE